MFKILPMGLGSIRNHLGHGGACWDMVAHWLRRVLSTEGSWVRLPLKPPCRDLGQVLYLQLPERFGVKLRYSIRAVVGSASEWQWTKWRYKHDQLSSIIIISFMHVSRPYTFTYHHFQYLFNRLTHRQGFFVN